jgi:hypothetical protein
MVMAVVGIVLAASDEPLVILSDQPVEQGEEADVAASVLVAGSVLELVRLAPFAVAGAVRPAALELAAVRELLGQPVPGISTSIGSHTQIPSRFASRATI